MVSLPTCGISFRFTASSATNRTVQRARPSGGSAHTMAMIRCFWLWSNTSVAPGRCFSLESTLQSGLLVAVAESTNGLWGERNRFGDLGSADVLSQLQQRQGAQNHADLLYAALQKAA